MVTNTFPRFSNYLILLTFVIIASLYSCGSNSDKKLQKKISIAIKSDRSLDSIEWHQIATYIIENQKEYPKFINDKNEINNDKLYDVISKRVKLRKDSRNIHIYNPSEIKDAPPKDEDITLEKVNFYLENSSSMNGYLEGENFRRNLRRLTREKNKNYSIDSYLINMEVVSENNIWSRIQNKNINTKIRDSDTGFILKTAIENQSNSEISIVVTDGIYSARNIDSADILDVDIEDNIKNLLSKRNFDTVIIKCISSFKGTYYVEDSSCFDKENNNEKTVELDQKRPFYIFIFGNPILINNYLNKGVAIEDLDGFTNMLRFNTGKNIKPDYTILSKGDEKKGSFGSSSNYFGIKHEVIEAETKSGSSANQFQFAIAVNYSSFDSLDENYLTDERNYTIESDYPYEILTIEPIENISSKAKGEIEKYEKKGNVFTHFIVLKAKKSAISGKIEIVLNKKIPDWVKEVGLISDCINDIKNNENQTFTLDKTLNGLLEAYNYDKITEYFSIQLTIKI